MNFILVQFWHVHADLSLLSSKCRNCTMMNFISYDWYWN